MTTIQSRYQGCLLGLAVGDALGTTVEFRAPGSFEPMTDIVGGGPFDLKPGQWTDDTSLALCLAESLVETDGFDPVDQLERYVRWYRDGHLSSTGACFDIGGTTLQSLLQFERTHEPYCGTANPRAAGNGSIMRLAPVPLFFARRPEEALARSADSSRTTHGATVCIDACRYMGGLIVAAVTGVSKDALLSERHCPVPGHWQQYPLTPEIDEIACGSFKLKEPPAIRGTGHVVRSLEAALWAFHKSTNFRDGALLAVNLGDDADTTGAVYGQLAGAHYGQEGIPARWRECIARHETILGFADRLLAASDLACALE
jgi:ADP-ribosyl-[dinitrogen reductase] hydrolase